MADIGPFLPDDSLKSLGNTIIKSNQGVVGWQRFLAGIYPSCSKHGAMNKMDFNGIWRCINCNIGAMIPNEVLDNHIHLKDI